MSKKIKIALYISIVVVILAVGMIFILAKSADKSTEEISTIDYVDRGNKYLIALSYDKAVIEFTEAIRVDPMNAEAYLGLAEAYVGMGDMDKAVDTLELGYEKTSDERIRAMLDELIGESEETTAVTTEVNAPKEATQDSTIDLYLPSKLTVFSTYGHPDARYGINLCYNGYTIEISSEEHMWNVIDDNTVVMDKFYSLDCETSDKTIGRYELCHYDELYYELGVFSKFEPISYSNVELMSGILLFATSWDENNQVDIDFLNYFLKTVENRENRDISNNYLIYNDNGYLIENNLHSPKLTYIYDDKFNLLKVKSDRDDTGFELIYENGRISHVIEYISGTFSPQIHNYEYNSNGNIVSVNITKLNETPICKCTYSYDEYGNIINRTIYNSYGEIAEKTDIEYDIIQVSENSILNIEKSYDIKFNR